MTYLILYNYVMVILELSIYAKEYIFFIFKLFCLYLIILL